MWLVMAIEADKASTFWKELHTLLDEPRGHEKVDEFLRVIALFSLSHFFC